ncbi:hypothetical protein IAR50_007623 [Cryptococcus sp. DSM 104548]
MARYLADTYDPRQLIAVDVRPGSTTSNIGHQPSTGFAVWAISKVNWIVAPVYSSRPEARSTCCGPVPSAFLKP